MKKLRGLLACGLALVIALAMMVVVAPGARAYGSTALWQVGLSFNCVNPTLCTPTQGGFWGWVEFDLVGGDATLTGCGHLVAAGPIQIAGAGHFNADITGWFIGLGSAGPMTFMVTGGTMTITGGTGGTPITIPLQSESGVVATLATPLDTGIPAVAGHYNTMSILGFTAPGFAFVIQVVQLTH